MLWQIQKLCGNVFYVSLPFRVPLAIVNKAHQANQIYPYAISLIESVRTYERTLEKVGLSKKFIFSLFYTPPIANNG